MPAPCFQGKRVDSFKFHESISTDSLEVVGFLKIFWCDNVWLGGREAMIFLQSDLSVFKKRSDVVNAVTVCKYI